MCTRDEHQPNLQALQEEMKPSGLFYNSGPGGFSVKNTVKVDQQALDEV